MPFIHFLATHENYNTRIRMNKYLAIYCIYDDNVIFMGIVQDMVVSQEM